MWASHLPPSIPLPQATQCASGDLLYYLSGGLAQASQTSSYIGSKPHVLNSTPGGTRDCLTPTPTHTHTHTHTHCIPGRGVLHPSLQIQAGVLPAGPGLQLNCPHCMSHRALSPPWGICRGHRGQLKPVPDHACPLQGRECPLLHPR